MNKTAIKNFAIWARNKLIADISYRAGLMGITTEGIQKALPQSTGTTEFYDIGTAEPYSISGTEVKQREKLVELIRRKEKETNYKTAYKYVLEEVAYTWFNRLIAVRFMEVNDYLPSHIRVLSSDSGKTEPDLLTKPFDAELSFTVTEEQEIYRLKEENKSDDAFRLLFIKQCNALNEILPALFEKTSDYTELLLNLSVVDQDGVLWHLVHDIPEADFDVKRGGQVEIIGWLYQYYNTEPKNEAFGKKGKISKEEIPAVTQLFTPDWIVRYMVENSLGRLWVEGHPNEELKAGWEYYLEEAEQEPEVQAQLVEIRKEYAKLNLEDIKVIDPCMGSGHILVYAFDVLMQIYESAGYSQRDAARSILENNLYGLDIDDRAFQLAYFAIMMKARQYNRRILNGEHKPNVYSIQESNGIDRNQLKFFGGGLNEMEKNNAIAQMTELLDTFKDAKEYGSILMVDQYDWELLDCFVTNIEVVGQMSMDTVGLDDTAEELKQLIAQGKILARKYHATITNPPYMSSGNFSEKLQRSIKKNYPDSKSDLYAVFIERCANMINKIGCCAMITMHTWMFLSRYEKMRQEFNYRFVNMVHLGARAFDEISGEVVQTVAFVLSKQHSDNYIGKYVRLVDYSGENEKEKAFHEYVNTSLAKQSEYMSLPGTPIAYWVTDEELDDFAKGVPLKEFAEPRVGMITGNNDRFIKCWWEVCRTDIKTNVQTFEESLESDYKWYPYNKGGSTRLWYGNRELVVWFRHGGEDIERNGNETGCFFFLGNKEVYFHEGITWNGLASARNTFRYSPIGTLFDSNKGPMLFPKNNNDTYYLLALFNTKVTQRFLNIFNPSISLQAGDFEKLPIIISDHREQIEQLSKRCVEIAKSDWACREISLEFSSHPLTEGDSYIKNAYLAYAKKVNDAINEALKIEEKLNRLFSEIYSIEKYIDGTPGDSTIESPSERQLCKSLLSYAVGCMFGRYSLDTAGLAYAGGTWDARKYEKFKPDGDNVIPLTDEEYLEDDIISRLSEFLKVVYGEQTLEENLDFIAKALGNKGNSSREIIRNYFLNDFFKNHCQTYSVTGSGKRPIYWLFDSGKNNGFKALIYLHRYNADTVGNLRIDYLHRMQRIYESEMSRMQDMIDYSTNAREVAHATKRREKLVKQLKECRDYDEKLAHLALSRIDLDLDDGVKKNYRKIQTANDGKFYEVLADSKNIISKE